MSKYNHDYSPPIELAYACGVSRSGQTSVAQYYEKLNPVAEILSTDMDVRRQLWENPYLFTRGYVDSVFGISSPAQALNQKFYDQEWLAKDDGGWISGFLGDNPKPYITRQFEQSRAVHTLGHIRERALDMATSPLAIGAPLIEGIAVLPEDIARMRDDHPEIDVRSVTIVNLNPKHVDVIQERVERIRSTGNLDEDWMAKAGWSNRRIAAYMGKMLEMSHDLAGRAKKEGLFSFDMGQGDFDKNVRHVAEHLSGWHGLVRQEVAY